MHISSKIMPRKALLYPFGNYLCIAFLGMILLLMCTQRHYSTGIQHVSS